MQKNNSILNIFLSLIMFFAAANTAVAISPPAIREIDGSSVNLDSDLININNDYVYKTRDLPAEGVGKRPSLSSSSSVLQGGVSELKAIVGKSQILKFDEPVKRLSITKPDLIDLVWLSPRELIMNGLKGGETTLIIWGDSGEPVFFNLFVENSNINFVDEIERIAPGEDLKIDFVNSGSDESLKVVLKGKLSSSITKKKIEDVAKAYGYELVDLTETLTPQIMLALKVVEVDRSKSKGRAFSMQKDANRGVIAHWWDDFLKFTNISKVGDNEADTILETIAKYSALGGKEYVLSNGTSGLNYTVLLPGAQNLVTNTTASESEGFVKVLAEPKLMATNGTKAIFNSGQEVPVLSSTDPVTGQNTYEYKNVGINVEFTPTILEDSERILLDIMQEISSIDTTTTVSSESLTSFGFTTKKAETQVELENGQTMVLAGLIKKDTKTKRTKTPWLSSIPVIGKLFDTESSFAQDETELMIFITPEIIKPYQTASGV